jgi:hypothetical protein
MESGNNSFVALGISSLILIYDQTEIFTRMTESAPLVLGSVPMSGHPASEPTSAITGVATPAADASRILMVGLVLSGEKAMVGSSPWAGRDLGRLLSALVRDQPIRPGPQPLCGVREWPCAWLSKGQGQEGG